MSTTPYLKLAMYNYIDDDQETQNNTLTYAIGAVGSTAAEAIATTPGTIIVAGAPAFVPDTLDGQHTEFPINPAPNIKNAVENDLVGHGMDMSFHTVQNLVFGIPDTETGPYDGVVNIWDATTDPYTVWGKFQVTISSSFTTIVENVDTGTPVVSLYSNSTAANLGVIGWQSGTPAPSTPLPLNFVIELENGEQTVDYIPLSVVNNCLTDDTLIEKMVEVEE